MPRVTRAPDDGSTSAAASRTLTQPDMVLIALYQAAGGTTNRVPYEELVLQAWRAFPQVFGLRNYTTQYPDASDIHKKLYAALKTGGYVVPLGNKNFRLTDKGLARAEQLVAELVGSPVEPDKREGRLHRDQQSFVRQALASRSYQRWISGDRERLIDYDARIFFGITPNTETKIRRDRVAFALAAIQQAKEAQVVGATDLANLATYLVDRFGAVLGEG